MTIIPVFRHPTIRLKQARRFYFAELNGGQRTSRPDEAAQCAQDQKLPTISCYSLDNHKGSI
jgi:hypothetical protein